MPAMLVGSTMEEYRGHGPLLQRINEARRRAGFWFPLRRERHCRLNAIGTRPYACTA